MADNSRPHPDMPIFGAIFGGMVYGICIPLSISKAVRHESIYDRVTSVVVFMEGYSIPGWVVGILLLVILDSHWGIFFAGRTGE